MQPKLSAFPLTHFRLVIALVAIVAVWLTYGSWRPMVSAWIDTKLLSHRVASERRGDDVHAHHAAENETAFAESTTLELTAQARLNLGLTPEFLSPLKLSTYRRSITMPAVVVPVPGRSQIIVTSPLNGIITHVHATSGEVVTPGALLFEVRLTYEDLVETQTLYLKTISELEVEAREIKRLESATESGAISGKSLLERRYAKEKLEAQLRSQREALRLHGLSDRQIDAIGIDGRLLRDLQVVAPDIDQHTDDEELHLSQHPIRNVSYGQSPNSDDHAKNTRRPLVIDDLRVNKGQSVTAGEKLCSLSDYSNLFIEGKAFEQDIAAVNNAAARGWTVDAEFQGATGVTKITALKLAFVGNSINQDTRTLSLFVHLPNEIMRDETNAEGQRFMSWKYRLGQRLQLQVPVEEWENQMVVPVDAVAKEGADWFVFQQNGKRFHRVPVHIKHRDQTSAVIANEGSIYPGDVIALKSAHQMQMAIKNKSGVSADPHAGHSH